MKSAIVLCLLLPYVYSTTYTPDWDSLDARPIPEWYNDAKFGIFMHWGVYSVVGYGSEWLLEYWKGHYHHNPAISDWMNRHYSPTQTYADFASDFKAYFYDPKKWADIFEASGAKYVVLTSKHCDGYTLFPSKYTFSYNSMDVGPKRDLIGEYVGALRKFTDLKVGLYYCMFEFMNPLFLQDKESNYTTRTYPPAKSWPESKLAIETYQPDVWWNDGIDTANASYWNSTGFLAWLYNESPVKDTVVTNDRWGADTMCKHGGYWTCTDRYNPKKLQAKKWESCIPLDKQGWPFRRSLDFSSIYSMEQLLQLFAEIISCGGNLLLDIGPTPDGTIMPIEEERLRQMGEWLKVNGEGIYGTKPWKHQQDSGNKNVWYTSKTDEAGYTDVYAIVLKWPEKGLSLLDPVPSIDTTVTLLGYNVSDFNWVHRMTGGIVVDIPSIPYLQMPCHWAWVFKIKYLANHF